MNALRMQLLAVHGPDRSPSQRYRIEQYLPWLAGQGVLTEYSGALASDEATAFSGAAPLTVKSRIALRAFLRRSWSLRPRARPFDLAFVQREAFFLGGAWAERLVARTTPLVFDFDDAIWMHAISSANRRFEFLKNVRKIEHIVGLAAEVVAGNEYLATWARRFSKRVSVIPTTVDTDRYTPSLAPRPSNGPVVIGWSGSTSTVAHLKLALPALRRVKARFGERVRFKIVGDPTFADEALAVRGEAWSSATEVDALRAMDVGLMPLPDDEWSKGKCGLKALTYMAVGIPVVLSPVGVNTSIVRDGVEGFLPSTENEWVERLSRLIEDASLRARLGEAGRVTVVERYSVERWRGPLLEVLRRAASRRDAGEASTASP